MTIKRAGQPAHPARSSGSRTSSTRLWTRAAASVVVAGTRSRSRRTGTRRSNGYQGGRVSMLRSSSSSRCCRSSCGRSGFTRPGKRRASRRRLPRGGRRCGQEEALAALVVPSDRDSFQLAAKTVRFSRRPAESASWRASGRRGARALTTSSRSRCRLHRACAATRRQAPRRSGVGPKGAAQILHEYGSLEKR
jgi:hypothetical protein